jgi:ribose transport system permease protein
MKNLIGVGFVLLVLYAVLLSMSESSRSLFTHQKIGREIGFLGILALGAGLVILAGGIDLSLGLLYGLAAISFPLLLEKGWNPWLAAGLILAGTAGLGSIHGVLITRFQLQAFLVTLCGAMIYRGLARWLTWEKGGLSRDMSISGQDVGGLSIFKNGATLLGVPTPLLVLILVAIILGVLLHATIYGRYLYAIGSNEQAARFAGIATNRYRIAAYAICSFLGGLGGLLNILDVGGANPSNVGDKEELFAITAAVLGGCSLRGGEGTVLGILIGAATLRMLNGLCDFSGLSSDLYPAVVGLALLLGTGMDEYLKRRAAARQR